MEDLGKRDALLQTASWARSMIDTSVPPVARVAFAFEADAVKRIAYAASFAKLQNPEHSAGPPEVKEGASAAAVPGLTADAPGTKTYDEVNWSALMYFADIIEVPRDLDWPVFREALKLVATAGVRKKCLTRSSQASWTFGWRCRHISATRLGRRTCCRRPSRRS